MSSFPSGSSSAFSGSSQSAQMRDALGLAQAFTPQAGQVYLCIAIYAHGGVNHETLVFLSTCNGWERYWQSKCWLPHTNPQPASLVLVT